MAPAGHESTVGAHFCPLTFLFPPRYSKKYETVKIEDDIKNLMSQRGK